MSAYKGIGIWLNYQQAVVVKILPSGFVVKELKSGLAQSGRNSRSRYWSLSIFSGSQLNSRRRKEIEDHFQALALECEGQEKIAIFGPGEAKHDFKNFILSRGILPGSIAKLVVTGFQISRGGIVELAEACLQENPTWLSGRPQALAS